MAISFCYQDTSFKLKAIKDKKRWITSIAYFYDYSIGDISIIFCSDQEILQVNKKYLKHNYYTDVITFPYSEGNTIHADIFISIDTVKHNALKYSQPFLKEVHRVIAHAILHLVGFSDSTDDKKLEMTKKEDECLALLPSFV